MTLITSKEYDEWIENLTIEDFPEIIGEFKKTMTNDEAKDIFKRCVNNPHILNVAFWNENHTFLPEIKGEFAKPMTDAEAQHLRKALEDDYLSQDELDEVLEKHDNQKLSEDEVSSLLAGLDIDSNDNQTKTISEKQLELNKTLRPCERTYNFQNIKFTADYINELASRNGLLWLLKEQKDNNVVFTADEIYILVEAVCDNWRRYFAST